MYEQRCNFCKRKVLAGKEKGFFYSAVEQIGQMKFFFLLCSLKMLQLFVLYYP